MIFRKLSRETYQAFLQDFFHDSRPSQELGRLFLATYFPGLIDADVSAIEDVHELTSLIQLRYVETNG